MAGLKKLPIGIENFEEMRREDFYYVDKSHVIEQLLTQWGKAVSYTHLDVYKRQYVCFAAFLEKALLLWFCIL